MGIFLGDCDSYRIIEKFDAKLYRSHLTKTVLYISAFIFTISYVNISISVYGSAFAGKEAKGRLLYMQARTELCLRYLMEPVWTPNSLPNSRCERGTPYYICLALIALWFFLLLCPGLGIEPTHRIILSIPVLTAAWLLLQAAVMQNDIFTNEVRQPYQDVQGYYDANSDTRAYEHDTPRRPRCLWICFSTNTSLENLDNESRYQLLHDRFEEVVEEMRDEYLKLYANSMELARRTAVLHESCKLRRVASW